MEDKVHMEEDWEEDKSSFALGFSVATKCNTLQHASTHCNMLHHTTTHLNTPQHNATQCNTMQHNVLLRWESQSSQAGLCCITLQHTCITPATHLNNLQQTATHTATPCNTPAVASRDLKHSEDGRGERAEQVGVVYAV